MSKIKFDYYNEEALPQEDDFISSILKEIINLTTEKKGQIHIKKPLVSNYYSGAREYIMLLYSKYIIENNGLDYSHIIKGHIDELNKLVEFLNKKFDNNEIELFIKRKIYTLLQYFRFQDYYIETPKYKYLDNYLDKNKKYLYIDLRWRDHWISRYVKYENVDIWDRFDSVDKMCSYLQIYDEIRNIKRKYYTDIKDININDYDEIIVANESPFDNGYEYIKQLLNKYNKKIIIIYYYGSIYNYKSATNKIANKEIKNDISRIIFDNYYTVIEYDQSEKNQNIPFLLLNGLSNLKIKDVINSEDTITDILIYVPRNLIISNGNKISFDLYNKEIKATNMDELSNIYASNKKMIDSLSELNRKFKEYSEKL